MLGNALTKPAQIAGADSWCCLQGSARVIRCLQDNREELSYECQATLFDAEVRMAEDIDFKYPMKRACSSELTNMCPGIEHGDARLIRCPSNIHQSPS